MDFKLTGKTALVTGSASGIGFSIAQFLAQEGAKVYVNGRTAKTVETAISKMKEVRGEVLPAPFNLELQKESNQLIAKIPHVDILINNLGIYEVKPFEEITDEDWLRIFSINVLSGIRLSRYYFPKMKQQNYGRIIFISSESAVNAPAEMVHYGMTKTAQLSVARGLAEMSAGSNVTVNSVLPGPTYTGGVEEFIAQIAEEKQITPKQVEQDFFTTVRPSSLIKRFIKADEVGSLVAFLCSGLAAAINGAALRVDGGVTRSIL